MGRRKSYDRDAVLDRAMRLFWARGFHAASTRDLAAAMGINVYSLYAEFGSKDGLYSAALERYGGTVMTQHFGPLESDAAGLADVLAVLDFFGHHAPVDNPLLGCLGMQGIAEQAPAGPTSRAAGKVYLERLRGAFAHALGRAVDAGELSRDAPVRDLSDAMAVTLLGVFVALRAGAEPALFAHATDQARARLLGFATG